MREVQGLAAIVGGTLEALERMLRRNSCFAGGLVKIEAACAIGAQVDPKRHHSPSFVLFKHPLVQAMA